MSNRQLPALAASRATGRSSNHRSARWAASRDLQANERPLRMRNQSGGNSRCLSIREVLKSSTELNSAAAMCQGRDEPSRDRSLITRRVASVLR